MAAPLHFEVSSPAASESVLMIEPFFSTQGSTCRSCTYTQREEEREEEEEEEEEEG